MSSRTPRRLSTAASASAAVLALAPALAACSSGSEAPAPGRTGTAAVRGEAAPSGGSPFWVDPQSDAARQVEEWQAEGRTEDAELLKRISERPVADWPSGDDPAPGIRRAVKGAAGKRTVVLVAYNIPHRDCGLYSAGGARDGRAYLDWIDSFATAIGDARALVILEPDAVSHLVDGCTPAEHHAERNQLLSDAIERLKEQPGTKVYLDAGNPNWIKEPEKLAEPLRTAGVAKADGFSLNVSNFETDGAVKTFGTRLSGLLDGAHFTVDTSRNGEGPLRDQGDEAWCNPPGRSLGTPPTAETGDELIDAYLWIKRPGDSDGTCRGGPAAGTWWPDYALGLARRAGA
ncbi:glycoside hydrolase family 6 protein [Streptomyces sp. IB2014 016-6]|uniref:glycoside hydrolase family 6 protein n=1 Tax=Streptomyces sp. IB2014 016-6 TaxID=2517818 RepID=UPI0011C90EC5|nr:glycoside hydrolase family 6 protein [Streptomyces sp. IB2014 016-6]TXL90853.1 endoglucanase [Streptomyces sp. IB2014 016-6]